MQSRAASVADYLAELDPDRRAALEAVRRVILNNLDPLYAECMQYGMIGYSVPHSVFPAGYHCDPSQPLPFAALASQKNYMSLYLMGVYCGCDGSDPTAHVRWFQQAWAKTGKKLDMGKACIRFKRVEDLALDVIGQAIRRVPAKTYIKMYEASLAKIKVDADARRAARAKAAPKRTVQPAAKRSTEPSRSRAKKA